MATDLQVDDKFQLGDHLFHSRLIVGTGKYDNFEVMRRLVAAVRR